MKLLLQRVSRASVTVEGKQSAVIQQGLLAFAGFEKNDTPQMVYKMADKLLAYRVFADSSGKMNLSVRDIAGGVLIVSQFTLAASTNKGLRPSFSASAEPIVARDLYNSFILRTKSQYQSVQTGIFGADMQVDLLNDGPVTFLLEL
ncbi:MAG: D-tyrosyl-tRNA(Tyr) deacylase [Cellvibrionaceae bacterium]|nr:D-tyrosyl-tRNA(Tyr) deacylase [Cellvibrionaceae bacterium]